MVLLRPALADDAAAIATFLHESMGGRLGLADWRRLFSYSWLAEKPDLGCIVEDEGRIVGFLGVVYADREREFAPTENSPPWHRS